MQLPSTVEKESENKRSVSWLKVRWVVNSDHLGLIEKLHALTIYLRCTLPLWARILSNINSKPFFICVLLLPVWEFILISRQPYDTFIYCYAWMMLWIEKKKENNKNPVFYWTENNAQYTFRWWWCWGMCQRQASIRYQLISMVC